MVRGVDARHKGEGESITRRQCVAAKALLNWTQADLAAKSGVGMSTIADFERGKRKTMRSKVMALRRVFEAEGLRFCMMGVCFTMGAAASGRWNR